ncbi:MlaD family protein [Gillisia limnaea]|uniref:Mammalian cell entry related domain protein n=1 Tax=Gillisia limnaea (strain DSM 15749 / LMG 21470 / R-8282) TaxID=865937 RepID=H2BUH3_GILLR|nr:MlaD family protein [Gillisia limnaea]EHQ03851.1 Mammalian cell entry related domain protein [Gillisia limnaea DSM 15749]
MRKNTSKNVQLGIFVVIGIILFSLGVYFIGSKQNLFGETIRINSVFKNVSGLQLGNNVRFAGVNVGTVKEITILNDTAINVNMAVEVKTASLIRKNAQATIGSDGLVGSMIVNILPGDNLENGLIKSGDTIESISKIATADMLTTLNTTNENAALLTADLLKITNSINNGEGLLGTMLKDEELVTNIKLSIANLQRTSKAASRSIDKLNNILSEIDYQESVAGLLLSDTVSKEKIKNIIDNLELSSQEINSISTNLNEFSANLRDGEGAINYLVQDTTFVNNLDSTIRNTEEGSEKLDEIMEAVKQSFLFRGYFRKQERREQRLNINEDSIRR